MPTVIPANPTVLTPITLHAAGAGCGVIANAHVDGFVITYEQTEACLCWSAAPPYSIDIDLGRLPAGEYTLVDNQGSYSEGDSQCPHTIHSTTQSSFQVLGVSEYHPVPAIGPAAAIALALMMVATAVLVRLRH